MAAEARLQEAQNRLTDCVGPRGIQKLVSERRRNGLQLPFRVTLRRHSRLALVTSWDEDLDRTDEVGVAAEMHWGLLVRRCPCRVWDHGAVVV
jgi:hypothetical protein